MYIIPAPQKLVEHNGEFIIKYDTRIVLQSSLGFQEFNYAGILQKHIMENLGFRLDITKAGQKDRNEIFLAVSKELKPEEYQLFVKEEGIQILGGNSNALLYGIQTLRQIISQKGACIPALLITDYPEIPNRGFYYDVTRGRIPTLQTLKALADKMSFYKLNHLQLYIEHSFLIREFSEVWRDDTPLTPEEILEFDRYCKGLNIELVPSIASFGHLHKVLSTKTYQHLCELEGSNQELFSYTGRMEHHTLDVSNDESFELVKSMLTQFIPLFSSKLFNICADETFDLGKGKSKPLAEQIGMDEMYLDFLKRLCDFIKLNGRQPMFWGDILVAKPEKIKELPEDAVCLNWDYCTNASEDNVKKLYELGVTQYLCPGVYGWRRLINHYKNAYENVRIMSSFAHKYQAEGILNTDWGDYGHICNPEFSTTGMIYGAAFSWNAKIPEYELMNSQISVVEYLDSSESFVAILHQLTCEDGFLWNHTVQYKELCQKTSSAEERRKYFDEINMESITKSNLQLSDAIHKLYQLFSKVDTSKRGSVKHYLVAAKGMQLMNALGATIGQTIHGIHTSEALQPSELAVMLEYWFKDYKEDWRSISKESELYRLQEVILWYTDLLREIS